MQIKTTENERQLIAVLVILALFGVFYIKSIKEEIKNGLKIEAEISQYEESIKPFFDIALTSQSFAIYDMDKKQFLYKRNAENVFPLASLAKVMSTVVAMENLPEDHVFVIQKEALGETGDNGLLVGEKWKRDDLLKYALVVSSNDAMYQIAYDVGKNISPESLDPRSIFVQKMNEKAKELNLKTFEFFNESGLDIEGETLKNGAYANARDMAKLFAYAVEKYPDIFSSTIQKTFIVNSQDKQHVGENTNPFVQDINGIFASKTGFTNISGGNLIIGLKNKNNVRMVVVVLGSTFTERFTDVKALSDVLN